MIKTKIATVGWREYVSLPKLKLHHLKAKIDTGARTSALHAFAIEEFYQRGQRKIRFAIHPIQRDNRTVIWCTSNILDRRRVSDSGGHRELRYVISTDLVIGEIRYPIEITLTNRDNMLFRMLLGRQALKNYFIVNPAKSYLQPMDEK